MNILIRPMPPTEIIVHHSLTADSKTVSWSAIRRYHVIEKGWVDIGYHAGIERAGDEYEVLLGRPWDYIGAHCLGHNRASLGICFIGNFDIAPPPDAQLACGVRVIQLWMRLFGITPDKVCPHSQFEAKSCPGTKFDMGKLREMVSE